MSRIEANFIRAHAPLAPVASGRGALDDHPLFESLAGPSACAFLNEKGECAIYSYRPVICRSHGIPVLTEQGVDACPLNASLTPETVLQPGPEPDPVPALNLTVLNTTLAAINALYCRQQGESPERVTLQTLAAELRARV